MNAFVIESVLRSVLGGKTRKRSKKALKYLTGRKGGTFVNAGTLLTAAGVAWGIYETLQTPQPASAVPPAGAGLKTGPYTDPLPSAGAGPYTGASQAVPLPPLPNVGAGPVDDQTRMVRLAVSAANADGTLNDQERAAILQHAGPQAADLVARELELRRPLAEIVAGVGDPAQRATLYVLAYTILRADEQVSGAERIYLAQLANLLGLDPATVQALERDTGDRIDALGDQGQLGG